MALVSITHIQRDFARHLRKVKYHSRYLSANLNKIFRMWAALPHSRQEYGVDGMQLHEWIEIETTVLGPYRKRWQKKSSKTRAAKAKLKVRTASAQRQLHFQF